jgi:biotin carboxyl carrier protein
MSDAQNAAVHSLLTLLELTSRVRWASMQEARFIAVNELQQLIPYHLACLYEGDANYFPQSFQLVAASGVVQPDPDSALAIKLNETLASWDEFPATPDKRDVVSSEDAPLPPYALAIPIRQPGKPDAAILLLFRNQPFAPGEIALAEKFADAFAAVYARAGHLPFRARVIAFVSDNRKMRLAFAALIVLLLFPVRANVLAPAEVVASEPYTIRAQINGVIQTIHVKPNAVVAKGDKLISFDKTELLAQRNVAQNSVTTAESELRQVSQQSFDDPQARLKLATAKGAFEKEKAELAQIEDLLTRADVLAPTSGVVIFDNVFDWVGRQVQIGEKILLLADPDHTTLEIRLPVQDAIPLRTQAPVLFFSDAAPHAPIRAEVNFHSYRASRDEIGNTSYRLEAKWDREVKKTGQKLGSKGTAKIYGTYKPLVWAVLRKPLSSLRQFLGV